MQTILGTGQLGLTVMELLLKDNPAADLLLVNRMEKVNATLPANVRVVSADVTDPAALAAIAGRSEVIYSCTDVPYQHWKDFYPAAAGALAHALTHSQAKLVFADNLYSYGNVQGAIMHEAMPHDAKTRKGTIRADVIKALLLSGEPFGRRVAFVKSSDFIGPRIYKGLFGHDFMKRLYSGRRISLLGRPALSHTFTFIGDFAGAMIKVGGAADAYGRVWHAPNTQPLSERHGLGAAVRRGQRQKGKEGSCVQTAAASDRLVQPASPGAA